MKTTLSLIGAAGAGFLIAFLIWGVFLRVNIPTTSTAGTSSPLGGTTDTGTTIVNVPPEIDQLKVDNRKLKASYDKLKEELNNAKFLLDLTQQANMELDEAYAKLISDTTLTNQERAKRLKVVQDSLAVVRESGKVLANMIGKLQSDLLNLSTMELSFVYPSYMFKLRPGVAVGLGYGDPRTWSGVSEATPNRLYTDALLRCQFFTAFTPIGIYTLAAEQSIIRPKAGLTMGRYINDVYGGFRNVQIEIGVTKDEYNLLPVKNGINVKTGIAVNF